MSMLKALLPWTLALLIMSPAVAGEPVVKAPTVVASDGFPAGHDTPEGAACDLARAFIRNDPALFLATCVEPYGSPEARVAYHRFLEGTVVQMKVGIVGSPPSPESPKGILKCFAARHLSKPGPATSGAAASGFQDVMFVDVSALLQNGTPQLCRTLVVRNKEGKWMVDPQPEQSPALSEGLDDEPPSTVELSREASAN